MPDAQTDAAPRSASRRTIVKGAAWAVPAVTLATAAPALATSPIPPNGLNGWVLLGRNCGATYEFTIDGRGNFTGGGDNDRGIWTFVPAPGGNAPTFAQIIFWFDRDNWSFQNQSAAGWTNLTKMNPQPSNRPANGYVAYSTTYTGSWTYFPQHEAWVADSDPYWREDNMPGRSCGNVCAYADRTITVNGETVRFRRGPACV